MISSKRAALADIPSAITFECLLLLAVIDYLEHLGDFGTCMENPFHHWPVWSPFEVRYVFCFCLANLNSIHFLPNIFSLFHLFTFDPRIRVNPVLEMFVYLFIVFTYMSMSVSMSI